MEPNIEKLKKITHAAHEAVRGLEGDLKAKAFEKILEKLLSQAQNNRKSKAKKVFKKSTTYKTKVGEDEVLKILINSLNRSSHPKIYSLKKALDRALYILKIAKSEKNIDGLTPKQISYILTNIFRIKSSAASISMALMDAKLLVDRELISSSGGKAYIYYLMKPGEDHLDEIISKEERNESDRN